MISHSHTRGRRTGYCQREHAKPRPSSRFHPNQWCGTVTLHSSVALRSGGRDSYFHESVKTELPSGLIASFIRCRIAAFAS